MDIARRFEANPIVTPAAVRPSVDGAVVTCVLNPGAFRFEGKVFLLMRVAERMPQVDGTVSTLIGDETAPEGVRVVAFALDDPKLKHDDPRVFDYDGVPYLTTLSHLRLAESDDGRTFTVHERPLLTGVGPYEVYGVEDCRVTCIDGTYYLTYTAVSDHGGAVACQTTRDWRHFERRGIILPPFNKDCTLFEETIDGRYWCLHRPIVDSWRALNIWIAASPDGTHWGDHRCLARPRPGMWDSERIGAGAAPIRTAAGWLEIYHGCDHQARYCLGALLLDLRDPTRVLARSEAPIMEPIAPYEQKGFFGNVVFTNGHIVNDDAITLYYGASDTVICGATLSIEQILQNLDRV